MPTAALPDEILLPGEGQVRALISCAGNPAAAFPDQRKTVAALLRPAPDERGARRDRAVAVAGPRHRNDAGTNR